MSEQYTFSVESESGVRLDRWLSDRLTDMSRSRISALIDEGKVLVNEKQAKPSLKLKSGDQVSVEIPEPVSAEIKAVPMDLDILYEDEDILIVNKPKGMVVHPSAGHIDDTLVNGIMHYCGEDLSGINGVMRPGIVHRIDKDTTGSLVICKNDQAHQVIADRLKVHDIERVYRGIVIGHLKEDEGIIDAPIGRDEKNRKRMAIDRKNGKHAVTHYRVIQRLKGYDDCEFRLETGRTHQIRVHLSSLGHPLLGDEVYGPSKCPFKLQGQTLHAMTIGFEHPRDGHYVSVSAPLPDYYVKLIKKLEE
ncbi:MAG: RluA family pseudouridine synthase [Lachnospiraceae bacterium]|nr:RluA family pseudouridine synthase [Candidatus Equihabitans merdae]